MILLKQLKRDNIKYYSTKQIRNSMLMFQHFNDNKYLAFKISVNAI